MYFLKAILIYITNYIFELVFVSEVLEELLFWCVSRSAFTIAEFNIAKHMVVVVNLSNLPLSDSASLPTRATKIPHPYETKNFVIFGK